MLLPPVHRFLASPPPERPEYLLALIRFGAPSSTPKRKTMVKREVSSIKNKAKRREVYAKVKAEKKRDKKTERTKRQKEAQELGEEAPPKQVRIRGKGLGMVCMRVEGGGKSKLCVWAKCHWLIWGRHGYPTFFFNPPCRGAGRGERLEVEGVCVRPSMCAPALFIAQELLVRVFVTLHPRKKSQALTIIDLSKIHLSVRGAGKRNKCKALITPTHPQHKQTSQPPLLPSLPIPGPPHVGQHAGSGRDGGATRGRRGAGRRSGR